MKNKTNINVSDMTASFSTGVRRLGRFLSGKGKANSAPEFTGEKAFSDIDAKLDGVIAQAVISELSQSRQSSDEEDGNEILKKFNIKLGLASVDKDTAIRMAGELLVEDGYVDESYVSAMLDRELQLSTYIGNGVAIPHGTRAAKDSIKKSGMVVLQFPDGIEFGENNAQLVIGIAGVGNEHLSILANIATSIDDQEQLSILKNTRDPEQVYKLFTAQPE